MWTRGWFKWSAPRGKGSGSSGKHRSLQGSGDHTVPAAPSSVCVWLGGRGSWRGKSSQWVDRRQFSPCDLGFPLSEDVPGKWSST